jgi:tagatose-6-phosphate ketose/aldose isomerase
MKNTTIQQNEEARLGPLSQLMELSQVEQKARGLLFTPREIAQQPDTWKTTLAIFRQHQAEVSSFLEHAGVLAPLEERPVVMLVGAGTSDYIGRALALLLREKWGCEVSACASTELLTNLSSYIVSGRKYLWISFSRSGDSPEAVAILKQAIEQYPEISHLILTCNAHAQMIEVASAALHSYVVVLDDAVNDRSLAMTSSFTNMLIMGQCLAHAWSIEEYAPILEQLSDAGHDFLPKASREAAATAALLLPRACFVGSGTLAGVAKESALKVTEMTAGQVKSISETVLGLRHGPMAALDTETLFVCFVSSDRRRQQYASDLLQEISQKGITGRRIVVGPGSAQHLFTTSCDVYLSVAESIDDGYRPVIDVMFGQLLGLHGAVARNVKPDAPSPEGVISRVVQEFRIY